MNDVERLHQYLGKASFASSVDRFSALECLAEIERENQLLLSKLGATAVCGCCHGFGWVVRDPDIGTDQECFVCEGSGVVHNAE